MDSHAEEPSINSRKGASDPENTSRSDRLFQAASSTHAKILIPHSTTNIDKFETMEPITHFPKDSEDEILAHENINKDSFQHRNESNPCFTNEATQTTLGNNFSSSQSSCSHNQKRETPSSTASMNPSSIVGMNPSLCQNCSKSMLSYIVLVQRFLDNVAREVSQQVDPLAQCFECVKERLNLPPLSFSKGQDFQTTNSREDETQNWSENNTSEKGIPLHWTRKTSANHGPSSNSQNRQRWEKPEHDQRKPTEGVFTDEYISFTASQLSNEDNNDQKSHCSIHTESSQTATSAAASFSHQVPVGKEHSEYRGHECENKSSTSTSETAYKEFERDEPLNNPENIFFNDMQQANQPHTENDERSKETHSQYEDRSTYSDSLISQPTSNTNFAASQQNSVGSCVDGILTTLHQAERSFPNWCETSPIWERLDFFKTEGQMSTADRILDEAYVTFARNNSDILGCLVLGASLSLCDTSRTVCILVSEGVDAHFMNPLSTVFHEIHHIRSLDSIGTTKLSLLDQPELGISFEKLNIWRLTQYQKCVFLSPDTMVLQNCDELFNFNELSAVADIGWPDCFNSAVFVYQPSTYTFSKLLSFAEKQGSYDGGDQGLLNSYFNTWSQDIHKKLSFIYNLMANVSYTYTPAFKQFGRSVKVVQFMGPYKPSHVRFFSQSGQIAPSSSVHPTYVQFAYIWINIFRIAILPGFSEEMRAYASSHDVLSANETLQFFPIQQDFGLDFSGPPSVRLHPQLTSLPILERLKLQTDIPDHSSVIPPLTPEDNLLNPPLNPLLDDEIRDGNLYFESVLQTQPGDTDTKENGNENRRQENLLPGSEIGDYQGMSAWEQGRMDYEGDASSDIIIQRLRYMIKNPEQKF